MNIFDKDNLLKLGFGHHNELCYLKTKNGSEIWLKDGNFYVAGCDCPNTGYAAQVYLENLKDLKDLYRLLTGFELLTGL